VVGPPVCENSVAVGVDSLLGCIRRGMVFSGLHLGQWSALNSFFSHLSIFWASFTSASLGFFSVLQLVFVPVVGGDVVYCDFFVGLVF